MAAADVRGFGELQARLRAMSFLEVCGYTLHALSMPLVSLLVPPPR